MRLISLLLLLTLLYTGTAEADFWSDIKAKLFGGNSDKMEIVKNQKNSIGLKACDIPNFLKQRLGAKIVKTKWREDKNNGTVALEIVVKQKEQIDTVTIAYKYSPTWVWHVSGQGEKIRPVNSQAKNWMQGRI